MNFSISLLPFFFGFGDANELCWWLQSKWLVSGIFAVVILCRHDGEAMWAALGSVVNSILSIVLKKILNQERPVPSLRSEPGMPSSHSQSIFYIFMFAIFSSKLSYSLLLNSWVQ